MMVRPFHIVVGALSLMAAACSDHDNVVQVANTATVVLVNDTDTPIALTADVSALDSASATLNFGQASACASVDLSNAVPRLAVRNVLTGASLTVEPPLSAGSNLTIIAFDDRTGTLRLATLDNHFTPLETDAGFRFFNGVPSIGAIFAERRGTLTSFVGLGEASPFVSVSTDSASILFSNRSAIVLDASVVAFPHGRNSTLVVGPPAVGITPLRFFIVQAC
ncbi:MAG TPA: hypothetical protein VGQ44_13550 [Gemmatimonadaceae bacterium]|nr:hypothetical protein [Gemmatimonadaceae bacterium]